MDEVWQNVKDYEGLYQVSNIGRIKSLDRTIIDSIGKQKHIKGIIKKQRLDSKGNYKLIDLSKEGITKTYLVHRLVAEAFIKNKNNLPCINHKDEDKTNNHVKNLEWCTYEYNSKYGTCVERILKSNRKLYQSFKKPVMCLNDGLKYESTVAVAKYYNIDSSNVVRVCNGVREHTKGLKFVYCD
jgi:NUMOD4 motif/HNH endonuclease